MLSQRIAEVELAARGGVGRIAGMPFSACRPDVLGQYAEELVALENRLDRRRTQCMALLGALYAYIDDIDDSELRQVMSYRYINGESWQRIAFRIGETDEQYPRRLHNRFLQRGKIQLPEMPDEI